MSCRRRDLLQAGVVQATTVLIGGWFAGLSGAALRPAPAWGASDDGLEQRLRVCQPGGDALEELLRRNQRFCRAWSAAQAHDDPQERARALQVAWPQRCQVGSEALAAGQRPWAAILCCADSRLAPEWLFASGPGELFEVRGAGNTAFAAGIASLEYAVAELAVPLILVMGHSGCGAVTAAMGDAPLTPLLQELVDPIRACLQPGMDLRAAIEANARATAATLPQRSALLAEAVAGQRLRIVAAVVDIGSGRVSLL